MDIDPIILSECFPVGNRTVDTAELEDNDRSERKSVDPEWIDELGHLIYNAELS